MKLQVTNIRFDFDGDDEISDDEKIDITDEITNTIWDVIDEDDLVEEITNATGWCVSSINYEEVK
jgi:uncharacterized protein with von Willebrand factor type A (vWA) domain